MGKKSPFKSISWFYCDFFSSFAQALSEGFSSCFPPRLQKTMCTGFKDGKEQTSDALLAEDDQWSSAVLRAAIHFDSPTKSLTTNNSSSSFFHLATRVTHLLLALTLIASLLKYLNPCCCSWIWGLLYMIQLNVPYPPHPPFFVGLVIYQILTWVKVGKERTCSSISVQDVFRNML